MSKQTPKRTILLSVADGPEGIEIYVSEDEGVVDWSPDLPALYIAAAVSGASVKLGPFGLKSIREYFERITGLRSLLEAERRSTKVIAQQRDDLAEQVRHLVQENDDLNMRLRAIDELKEKLAATRDEWGRPSTYLARIEMRSGFSNFCSFVHFTDALRFLVSNTADYADFNKFPDPAHGEYPHEDRFRYQFSPMFRITWEGGKAEIHEMVAMNEWLIGNEPSSHRVDEIIAELLRCCAPSQLQAEQRSTPEPTQEHLIALDTVDSLQEQLATERAAHQQTRELADKAIELLRPFALMADTFSNFKKDSEEIHYQIDGEKRWPLWMNVGHVRRSAEFIAALSAKESSDGK